VSSRKGQFDLAKPDLKNAAAAAVWNAVLSTQYDILPMKKLDLLTYLHRTRSGREHRLLGFEAAAGRGCVKTQNR
jgi:hypothetical protein